MIDNVYALILVILASGFVLTIVILAIGSTATQIIKAKTASKSVLMQTEHELQSTERKVEL